VPSAHEPQPRLPMLLRVREVMTELACSRSHVYDLIGRGELSFIRDGRMVRVTRESLTRYVRRRVQGGG
jgi:excisionase family DNA binding protein